MSSDANANKQSQQVAGERYGAADKTELKRGQMQRRSETLNERCFTLLFVLVPPLDTFCILNHLYF